MKLEQFMNSYKTLILLTAFIIVSAVTAQTQSSLPAKDSEAIRTIQETYRTAWLKNDEKTILSLFTDDAALYPNGNKPVKGKADVQKFWFAPSDTITSIKAFDIKIEDITGNENFAVLIGSNELQWISEKKDKSESKQFVSKGYFISVYIKRGREWKILSQFWNARTEEIK